MKFSFDNPWVTRIFAVVLAVGLFFFVNLENQSRFESTEPTDGASIEGSEIITNLPIEVNVDTDQYFVSGIPDSATLRIQGPQAVIFQTVATQDYTVSTPNLNELGEGNHTVELQAEGLPDSITASVSPGMVNLTIEEKQVEEHQLSVEVDEDLDIAEGYEILEPSLSTEVVQLSGAASTMAEIDRVVVEISSEEEDIRSDILISAQVLVLDASGNPLNVNANPDQVEINVPVVRTQKEVPIVLREGSGGSSDYTYELSLSNAESESIVVRGDPAVLEDLQNFPVTVNLEGITESTLVTVSIDELPEGIEEVNQEEVEVLIEATENNQNSTLNN
jgi:YbbR domain-containing protein